MNFAPESIEGSELDTNLRKAVCHLLKLDERTTGLPLRVGVLNGVVHLAGEVPSLEIWELVGEIVARLTNVRGVVNRISAPGAPKPDRTIHLDL